MKCFNLKRIVLGIGVTLACLPAWAGDHHEGTIEKLMALPKGEIQGQCMRKVLAHEPMGTKELFATEVCPTVQKTHLEVTPDKATATASRGELTISYDCTVTIRDYYAGKLKKTLNQDGRGRMAADYIYALEELTLKNIKFNGSQACAAPIKEFVKKFN